MRLAIAILVACFTSPASADRYDGPAPVLDTRLLSECLGYDFLTSWQIQLEIPPELTPEPQACKEAKQPCHMRYDLPLGGGFDLSTLAESKKHQVRHCLFQHLELAEWLAFENNLKNTEILDAVTLRQEVRSWLRYVRKSNAVCATKFAERDVNRVACQFDAALRFVPNPEDVKVFQERLKAWEDRE